MDRAGGVLHQKVNKGPHSTASSLRLGHTTASPWASRSARRLRSRRLQRVRRQAHGARLVRARASVRVSVRARESLGVVVARAVVEVGEGGARCEARPRTFVANRVGERGDDVAVDP